MSSPVVVEFCGEMYPVSCGQPLTIGRDGRLTIDDNPYLHRSFLEVGDRDTMWWLTNVGSQLTATVADEQARMQWQLTRFNRKLDNVCQKLARAGIRGLHGEPGRLAVNRRARLVEYALAARLVQKTDLDLLDGAGVED